MSLVDKFVLLFLLTGHVLVPLVFLIIIFFMKRKRKNPNKNNTPIPWTALLIVQAVLDFTILPFWMFMGLFVGVMTTDAPKSNCYFKCHSTYNNCKGLKQTKSRGKQTTTNVAIYYYCCICASSSGKIFYRKFLLTKLIQ